MPFSIGSFLSPRAVLCNLLRVISLTTPIALFLLVSTEGKAATLNLVSLVESPIQLIGEKVSEEVFSRLDIDIEIESLPAKRARYYVSTGEKDGEVLRVFNYGVNNPNVLRVPTPYYELKTSAFVLKDSGIKINDKNDINKYRLIVQRGHVHSAMAVKDVPENNVIVMDSEQQIFSFLGLGRADIAILTSTDGQAALASLGIKDVIELDIVLALHPVHIYLHKRHKNLVPKIDEAIRTMKESGQLEKIITKSKRTLIDYW